MNVDISSALSSAIRQAINPADINKFVQKFAAEFQKAIDAEYETILIEAIKTESGWLWDKLSKLISDATYTAVYSKYYHPDRKTNDGNALSHGILGEPVMYKRRYGNNGLADPNNIRLELRNGEIWAENITAPKNSGGKLEDIILNGGPYDHNKGIGTVGDFRTRRDFYAEAQAHYEVGAITMELNRLLSARAQAVADEVMKRIS